MSLPDNVHTRSMSLIMTLASLNLGRHNQILGAIWPF